MNRILKIILIPLLLISAIIISGCLSPQPAAIVPGNLVQNGGFDSGLSSWIVVGDVTTGLDNLAGSVTARLNTGSSIKQQVALLPSTPYKVTLKVRNWASTIQTITVDTGGLKGTINIPFGDYILYSYTFTSPSAGASYISFTPSSTLFFDDIVLIQTGSSTTPIPTTPAVGDFTRKIVVSSVGGKVDGYKNGAVIGTSTYGSPLTITLNSGESWGAQTIADSGYAYEKNCFTNVGVGTVTCVTDGKDYTSVTVGSASTIDYKIEYYFTPIATPVPTLSPTPTATATPTPTPTSNVLSIIDNLIKQLIDFVMKWLRVS